MREEHWVGVRTDEYDEPHEVGAEIAAGTFISPYDVPNGVRLRAEPEKERNVIEFRYMVDEPYRRQHVDEVGGICVRLGRHSERILGVEMDVTETWDAEVIRDAMGRAAEWRANHDITRKIIKDLYAELVRLVEVGAKEAGGPSLEQKTFAKFWQRVRARVSGEGRATDEAD